MFIKVILGISYGVLIDILEEVEKECPDSRDIAHQLSSKIQLLNPDIVIGRESRFYETVKRIAAPMRPSIRGDSKLKGSLAQRYRDKVWIPRVRNNPQLAYSSLKFPNDLVHYGLNEKILETVFIEVEYYKEPLSWHLRGVPCVGFYQELHPYLKKWPRSHSATKSMIGRFYIAIDMSLKIKGCRPDNAYRFIEGIAFSDRPRDSVMKYGYEAHQVKQCCDEMKKLTVSYEAIKEESEKTKNELLHTHQALRDIRNELHVLKRQRDFAERKADKFKRAHDAALDDFVTLEESTLAVEEENHQLSSALHCVQQELSIIADGSPVIIDASSMEVSFQTKVGKKMYSPAIRKLYYSMLVDQIPPAKISSIIKSVLKCFLPNVNVNVINLPKDRCAGYMRSAELQTITMAHKAVALSKDIDVGHKLHLNTDGTTLGQKKLGSVSINGMAIAVNEVTDGTADTIVEDVSKELKKLRDIAHALNIPNADSINWTLLSSSSSDSASTQKRFNCLIEECRVADEEKFGQFSTEALDLIENFCAMHLGCNLRKAFLSAIKNNSPGENDCQREYFCVDVLVHEFCKIFGKHGTPEYGSGCLGFPDFLISKSNGDDLSKAESAYYQAAFKVTLSRQVGSRYFVAASNALKIIFLRKAALEFLVFTGKSKGNKLEREVYRKLQEPCEVAQLKADALMFFHVYADLVMLAKSNDLKKTTLDMNQHYLDLHTFVCMLEDNPRIIMDETFQVFHSEKRLYEDNDKTNHRMKEKSLLVHKYLFSSQEWDSNLVFPYVSLGATSMKLKLSTYAKNQLPGGIYWDCEPNVQAILKELRPSNDICESILGLNDYLHTSIPNSHQIVRSNLVQAKKNHTIKWFDELPSDFQDKVVHLAVERRATVLQQTKQEEIIRGEKRRARMLHAHAARLAVQERVKQQLDKLHEMHLIAGTEELKEVLAKIDQKDISNTKKKHEKMDVLRVQINIRKKLLKQNIHIPLSQCGKQRLVCDIQEDLEGYIVKNPLPIVQPNALVGKHIKHRFEIEDSVECDYWYSGMIVDYDPNTHLHEIKYDGEEEHCFFAITIDIIMGDLIVENN
jgi:hypothetical protein